MDSSTSVSTQPAQIPLPSTTIPTPPTSMAKASPTSAVTYPPVNQFTRTRVIITALTNLLVLVCIGSLTVLAVLGAAIGYIAVPVLSFALVVSVGAIVMLTGNSILRAAHLAHYTSNVSASCIGAIGILIPVFIIASCFPKAYDKTRNGTMPWYIRMFTYLLIDTLSGTIGTAVLLHRHVDLGGIDVISGTLAGAIGGAILTSVFIFIDSWAFSLFQLVVFSPVLFAIRMGFRWAYIASIVLRHINRTNGLQKNFGNLDQHPHEDA